MRRFVLADKIANFEDYVRKDVKQDKNPKPPKKEEEKEPVVKQETMEIEIEDPYQFLNAQERDEYLKQRRLDEEKAQPEEKRHPEEIKHPDEKSYPEEKVQPEEPYSEEEYDDEYEDEEYEEEYREEKRGVDMNLVVRIASVLTGIVILILVGFLVKVKIVDRYLAPDPDEVQTEVVAVPEGYVAKNDTVEVSGASSLNLRSGPGTGSSKVAVVNEGTQLKRIAVAEDGSWALVEYEGQQLYASMKYLTEK